MSTSDPPEPAKYETTDAHPVPIWLTGAGLVAGVALSFAIVMLFFNYLHHRETMAAQNTQIDRVTAQVAATRPQFPAPRLQVAPSADLAVLRAREEEELGTYGWIDRKAGIVRLPIARAMDLLAKRGLPVQGDPNAPPPTRTSLDMQQARPQQRQTGPSSSPAPTPQLQEVK